MRKARKHQKICKERDRCVQWMSLHGGCGCEKPDLARRATREFKLCRKGVLMRTKRKTETETENGKKKGQRV